jgi:hypothetical protein
MKASKFSDAQKAFILKQGRDGVPVADICRKAGISRATYFNWKKEYEQLPWCKPLGDSAWITALSTSYPPTAITRCPHMILDWRCSFGSFSLPWPM